MYRPGATMGDRKDDKFVKNFREAKKHGYIVGAYHYYDPNQNSTLQTENYIKTIKLKRGDFIPIVDLERFSSVQSFEKLKQGLQNCLNILEKKYNHLVCIKF
jgi:lysozyme